MTQGVVVPSGRVREDEPPRRKGRTRLIRTLRAEDRALRAERRVGDRPKEH